MQKKPKVDREQREFVKVQFCFFKVGKTTPAKMFLSLMPYPLNLTLHALKRELIATQIGRLDTIRKMCSVVCRFTFLFISCQT